jgi:hypothetical protein
MAVTPPVGTAGGGGDVGTGGRVVVVTGRGTDVMGAVVGGSVGSGRGGKVEVVLDGGGCTFVVEGTVELELVLPPERTNEPALR